MYDEDNARHISGFIAEKSDDRSPVSFPSAVLLLGSGLSIVGGLSMIGRKREHPDEVQRQVGL